MDTHLTPFSALTPDFVLNAMASVGLSGDGRLLGKRLTEPHSN